MGYGAPRSKDNTTLLVALEMKQRSEFSHGEVQLITFLAILRENCLRAKKNNIVTQGFYSDGTRFTFIHITTDGIIRQSTIFDITRERDLKAVFNFIIIMMETAMKSIPDASPTKPGQLREKEVNYLRTKPGQRFTRSWIRAH